MTIAELERLIQSKQRIIKWQAQERASSDYILADLIGRSMARIYNSSNRMPKISEVYPNLFDAEEIEDKVQQKKDELSALRFKQFAETHNKRFKEASVKK